MKKHIIKTTRLIIRPLEASDYAAWEKSFLGIKKKMNHWDWSPSEYDKKKWQKKFRDNLKRQKNWLKNDKTYQFGIFRKSDGAYLGVVSLMDISREVFQNAYIGYHIFNMFWGEGYAFEASKAVIKYGFLKLGLHRIEAGIEPKNKRSLALAKRLKMNYEGLSKRRLYLGGKWIDLKLFVALSEDYGIKWKPEPKKKK